MVGKRGEERERHEQEGKGEQGDVPFAMLMTILLPFSREKTTSAGQCGNAGCQAGSEI